MFKEDTDTTVAYSVSEQERLALVQTFRHLKPGAIVDLQFNSETPFRLKTKLIGFDEGKYLIVSAPATTVRDYGDIIREGAGCIVRTLVEGEAGQCIAFRSNIELIPLRPKGLLFISFPQQIESISLRKESRVSTQLPVTFVHRDENNPDALFDAKTEVSGYIKDISSGGCRISAEWPQHHSTIQLVPVYIKVTLANGESLILKAEIKNQQREDHVTVSLGMMFIQDDTLNKLLDQLSIS